MNLTEKDLDQLFQLQQKRAQEIAQHGELFTIDGTDKSFLAIASNHTLTCEAAAPIKPGGFISKSHSEYYVTAVKSIAGAVLADVLPVLGHYAPTAQTPVTNPATGVKSISLTLSPLPLPHLGLSAEGLKVPAASGFQPGDIIKLAGGYHRITGVKRAGACNICSLTPYELPNAYSPTVPKHFTDSRTWKRTLSYE